MKVSHAINWAIKFSEGSTLRGLARIIIACIGFYLIFERRYEEVAALLVAGQAINGFLGATISEKTS